MLQMNDTIAAIATPPGTGAIGIVRLSGSDAIGIASRLFRGKPLADQPSHTLHFGRIMDGERVIDEVVVSLFKAPRSYTGEDIVEISCHGSQYVLEQVMHLCLQSGARMAGAGEFTLRAYMNGKLDLAQAEAVADLIASTSSGAHRAAMHNLKGGFSSDLAAMREELIRFSALIELELDFSEEDVEFADRGRFYELLDRIMSSVKQMLESFGLGNALKNGVSVAIAGKPNAGKSTLLNALLNDERAIVSELPGTTRDTIEEALNINGILFRLIDTAGIREHTTDVVEQQGIARSRVAMDRADIVVYLYDVAHVVESDYERLELLQQVEDLKRRGALFIVVGNKADLAGEGKARQELLAVWPDTLLISAKNRENIDELRNALYSRVAGGGVNTEGTIVTNVRHYTALRELYSALGDIRLGLDQRLSGDLLSPDIRRCLEYLGAITGQVTTEDKLDYIFSKFCIGK